VKARGKPQPWTTEEKQLLARYYTNYGPHVAVEKLAEHGYNRSLRSVQGRAFRTGIKYGIPKNYMAIGELVETMGGAWSGGWCRYVIDKARKDKVLFEPVGSDSLGRKVRSVPEKWAWQELDAYSKRQDNEHLDWWTIQQIADYTNYAYETIRKSVYPSQRKLCNNKLLQKMDYLKQHRVQGSKRRWLYNPEKVKEVFNAAKRAA